MPMHPITSTLMYRGMCTIPDILSYSAPVNLPEDEVEGETLDTVKPPVAVQAITLEIREAFKVFDRDGNGFISKQELGMAMRSLGYMPNEVELEVIIQRLDMDGDGQVDFEEFVTLLGPKLTAAGMPDKFNGTDFDSVFWKCDMQKLTVEELKRLLYDTFCDHLSMKDIENIIMTEENHIENPEDCQVPAQRSKSSRRAFARA
ncbi:calcium-binding protein 7 isoform X4 [Syngnathoides biaculeatus]|uniref:calcium-binding protein 7 isoform X4 n=1 Tax=Syngnathoides biaculeatus TaxID=300417 RepID=UPI002ADD8188|nr:calcium-binding protein 7 isoform X4 [Syngnathoides biaculeatus]